MGLFLLESFFIPIKYTGFKYKLEIEISFLFMNIRESQMMTTIFFFLLHYFLAFLLFNSIFLISR